MKSKIGPTILVTLFLTILFVLVMYVDGAIKAAAGVGASPTVQPDTISSVNFSTVREINMDGQRWVEVQDPKNGMRYFLFKGNGGTPPVLVPSH